MNNAHSFKVLIFSSLFTVPCTDCFERIGSVMTKHEYIENFNFNKKQIYRYKCVLFHAVTYKFLRLIMKRGHSLISRIISTWFILEGHMGLA